MIEADLDRLFADPRLEVAVDPPAGLGLALVWRLERHVGFVGRESAAPRRRARWLESPLACDCFARRRGIQFAVTKSHAHPHGGVGCDELRIQLDLRRVSAAERLYHLFFADALGELKKLAPRGSEIVQRGCSQPPGQVFERLLPDLGVIAAIGGFANDGGEELCLAADDLERSQLEVARTTPID